MFYKNWPAEFQKGDTSSVEMYLTSQCVLKFPCHSTCERGTISLNV